MRNITDRAKRIVREPLTVFVIVGVGVFALFRAVQPEAFNTTNPSNRIVITQDDLRQMSVQWLAQGRPPLTTEQCGALIEVKVREEVLFREAVALGLDRDDTIVKRRMVQKMDFLARDVAASREPATAELKRWFDENVERFKRPPRVSFRHLYFSTDKRGARTREDAALALVALKRSASPQRSGDPFMFQDTYAERTSDQVAKDFGPGFAQALFTMGQGAWQGPIESGYGWHVIYVDSKIDERAPEFEEVESEVKSEWIPDQTE